VVLTRNAQEIALAYARLFSTFYGITNTVGTRLIARAILAAGFSVADIEAMDLSDLDNPRTKILQQNLFLRQPYVELGKGLVDKRFERLQADERKTPGALSRAMAASQTLAQQSQV